MLYNYHPYLIPKHFITSKKKIYTYYIVVTILYLTNPPPAPDNY